MKDKRRIRYFNRPESVEAMVSLAELLERLRHQDGEDRARKPEVQRLGINIHTFATWSARHNWIEVETVKAQTRARITYVSPQGNIVQVFVDDSERIFCTHLKN